MTSSRTWCGTVRICFCPKHPKQLDRRRCPRRARAVPRSAFVSGLLFPFALFFLLNICNLGLLRHDLFFLLVVVVVLKSTLAPCKFCLGLLEHGFNFCHMLLLSTNAGCSVVVRLSAYSTSHVCKCKGAAKKDYKPRRSEMAPAGMKTTMVR